MAQVYHETFELRNLHSTTANLRYTCGSILVKLLWRKMRAATLKSSMAYSNQLHTYNTDYKAHYRTAKIKKYLLFL